MSYEGYTQILCKNGHLSSENAHVERSMKECPVCKAGLVWWNAVDDTNCDAVGRVDMKKLLLLGEERSATVVNGRWLLTIIPAVYRIPSEEETLKLSGVPIRRRGFW